MELTIQYVPNGICFGLRGDGRNTFPLERDSKEYDYSAWERLNTVEQLWYDGLLVFNQDDISYLLPTESYFLLDEDTKQALGLPPETAKLNIFERGNIGNRNYLKLSQHFGL